MIYNVTDGYVVLQIEAESAEAARREYVLTGDYGELDKTVYITCTAKPADGSETGEVYTDTVQVDSPEGAQ